VLLVLSATLLGARVAAVQDDSTEYWALRTSVAPGDTVTQESLLTTRVRLSTRAGPNYLRADEEFAAPLDELVWSREVAAGSLIDRGALTRKQASTRSQLPLSVAVGASPADLARGDVVDVWVGPGPGEDSGTKATRVLESVPVVQAGDGSASLASSSTRTVLVDVDDAQLQGSVVGTVGSGHVTLVRVAQ